MNRNTLSNLLNYDPVTGDLTWKEKGPEHFNGSESRCQRWNKRFVGLVAGSEHLRLDDYGEVVGVVRRVLVKNQSLDKLKVIYCLATGEWPCGHVSLINDDEHSETDYSWDNITTTSGEKSDLII